MLKTAYNIGVQQALEDFGIKTSSASRYVELIKRLNRSADLADDYMRHLAEIEAQLLARTKGVRKPPGVLTE